MKLDSEKAYNGLRWGFIRETLMEMRLPQRIVNVMMHCISTYSMSILWNSEPTAKFIPSRGIRQGDPLSQYIFVVCMERLSELIEEEVRRGDWRPIQASRGGPKLASLFFADDIILFAEATSEQAHLTKSCLDKFCQVLDRKLALQSPQFIFLHTPRKE